MDPQLLLEALSFVVDFHRGIVRGSGNSVLCSLFDGLSGPATRARVWRGLTQEDAVGRTLREHRAVPAAPRDRAARAWATSTPRASDSGCAPRCEGPPSAS